jgi:hypothetical protein
VTIIDPPKKEAALKHDLEGVGPNRGPEDIAAGLLRKRLENKEKTFLQEAGDLPKDDG